MKHFSYFALFLTMLITACGNIPRLSPIATSTSLPTINPPPTNAPTQMPTATSLPSPTATEELTPEQLREREFGHLVPQGEQCLKFPEHPEGQLSFDYTQDNTTYTQLIVRATDPANPENAGWKTVELGAEGDKKLREVLTLRVVCRDAQDNIVGPFKIILGGRDFGKNGTNANGFYTGGWHHVIPAEEILKFIKAGDPLEIDVAIKPGQGNLKKVFWPADTQFQANEPGIETNELARLAVLTVRDDPKYAQMVNLFAQGKAQQLPENFLIIPSRLVLNPQ
jgi:hypothetical protein